MQRTLNLGILAHVDAGKTTLTERLLYAAGIIDEIGSVDDGSTHTDFLALERQRGITIRSAVVSFPMDDTTVNLIDTPGHPDFIAEVERVLNVLDGAVLLVSAVEGVQPQTRLLMRALRRLGVPTLIFVNKIDRLGARYEEVLRDISERLTPATIAMGSVRALGSRAVEFAPGHAGDPAFTAALTSTLVEQDDALLTLYIEDEAKVSYRRLRKQLAAQTRTALLHPVFFGSAKTGAGVDSLAAGIPRLLPPAERDVDGPLSGSVFKIERGPTGEKIAYVRMFSGTLRTRDRVRFGNGTEATVTAINVFEHGSTHQQDSLSAGEIGQLRGLRDIRIGDAIGARQASPPLHHFAPPSLETVVTAIEPSDKGKLRIALAQLAEQDPLINVRQDNIHQEISVSLYGEVQKEVIQATLANDYGIEVSFRETTTICIERPAGTGAAVERLRQTPNPFLATVGLRIDPGAAGSGVEFRLEVEFGSMPLAFFRAVEETVRETLRQGIYGWQVTDCIVTMTHSGYLARHSHAHQGFSKSMSSTGADFRGLTPLVVMSALSQAGTVVYEPIHSFHLEVPAEALGPIAPVLARLGAIPGMPTMHRSTVAIEGEIPAARVHELRQQLPSVTSGEGVLENAFDHYQPVTGKNPARSRLDNNPLDREEYLLRVVRRTSFT